MPKSLILLNKTYLIFMSSVVAYGFYTGSHTDFLRSAAQVMPLLIIPLTLFAHSLRTKALVISAFIANLVFCAVTLWVFIFSVSSGAIGARVVLFIFTMPFLANVFFLFKEMLAAKTPA